MPAPLIPGYRILKLLGEGGMAKVYLAVQENFDRQVALKIMAPELAKADPQYGERFLREARIVAQLMHPHIVTVFDVGTYEGMHYLSMEYVPGRDLSARRETLTLRQNLTALKQIALALDFAHKKGYIHRDIKPENILIHDDDGHAVLTDFGIARVTGTQQNLTQTGTAIGTPSFMSPEQALGKPIDQRSDLYSMGVVLFYVLTGRVPFTADSAVAVGLQHAVEPIPRLEGAFIQFQPVLEKVMAKQPERRVQTGEELAAVLEQLIAKLSLDTENLWQESVGAPPIAAAATVVEPTPTVLSPAVAEKPAAKPTPSKQPTPFVAQRDSNKNVPVFVVDDSRPSRARQLRLLGFLIVLAALVWIYRVEVAGLLLALPDSGSNEHTTASSALPAPVPAESPPLDNSPVETKTSPTTENPVTVSTTSEQHQEQTIADQLLLAKQLLDSGELIEPEAQNAEMVYQRVLHLDSNNTSAKDGLVNVGIALAARGLRFTEAGDLARAQRDYERALLLAPRDRDVQLLKQRLALLSRDKDADDLVHKAKIAVTANRWLLPDGDNAQDYYARALAIQPAHREALAGSKELEQSIANRIRFLWQRKQFVDASDLLALAQKRYVASDELDAVAAQTVGSVTNKIKPTEPVVAPVSTATAPPSIRDLRVTLQTDEITQAKFLQAEFAYDKASDGTLLTARVTHVEQKKMVTEQAVRINAGAGSTQFPIATLDDNFANGKYLLQLFMGDKKLAEVNFSVGS